MAHDVEHPIASDLGDFTFHRALYEDVLLGGVPRLAQMPYDELAHMGKRFLWPWQWGWKLR